MNEAGTPTDCSAVSSVESLTAKTPADCAQAGQNPVVRTEVTEEALSPLPQSPVCDNAPSAEFKPGESEPRAMAARAYQLEMFQRSLERNVIVAMDTGSGKTQVAVLRIKAELDICPQEKIVWFLAPTVVLCSQQFNAMQLQMAAIPMKLITGNDNVDTWEAPIWEAVLDGVRIVVSTYQILLDALSHAFVRMDQLALIVFDEVHNCIGNHPGGRIMSNFFHRHKEADAERPAILGLSATPSIRSNAKELFELECLFDATCVSPTLHRQEVLKHVKRPHLCAMSYNLEYPDDTASMKSLREQQLQLDIMQDPYIQSLLRNPTDRNKRAFEKAVTRYDTFCMNQFKGLWGRANEINQQLGRWATDYYIWKAKSLFLNSVFDRKSEARLVDAWLSEEKQYLADKLQGICAPQPSDKPANREDVSEKFQRLLVELLAPQEKTVVGIIFVKERATAVVLCALLSALPAVREQYRMGFMVGTSNYATRRCIYDLSEEHDLQTLQNFRSGKINLLVATSVLEEGIDVPACNLVVCYDMPATPKGFIQRRGRARMRDSRLVLLIEEGGSRIQQWSALEEEMNELYQDQERQRTEMEILEAAEDVPDTFFEVEATGARIDFDDAKSHLEHFCRTLSQGEFVDCRPDYIIHKSGNSLKPQLTAEVVLPSFLPEELRSICGKGSWFSEKNATKDAAFQAYISLYRAGLVTDHLLPYKSEEFLGVEQRLPEVNVDALFSPWANISLAWKQPAQRWLYTIGWYQGETLLMTFEMLLATHIQQPDPIRLYVDTQSTCDFRFSVGRQISAKEAALLPDHTTALLGMHFGHRWAVADGRHVVRFFVRNQNLSLNQISSHSFDPRDSSIASGRYLIRDPYNSPYILEGIIPFKPHATQIQNPFKDYDHAPEGVPYLVLSKWSKRSDFLHPVNEQNCGPKSTKPYSRVLPMHWATVDSVPSEYVKLGMLLPSIIHEMHTLLVAKEAATTLLEPIGITDHNLAREAICAKSASEPVHYERLEFLGDSILKYCSTIQASTDHPEWPEGYLSLYKDRLVSNSRLSRAAIETGLARFIITSAFTGIKWRPVYVDEVLSDPGKSPPRKLSTKVLADVIEALIGSSYKIGGIPTVLKCLEFFVGEGQWEDIDACRQKLFGIALKDEVLPPVLEPLERLIGYTFRKKSLLIEACTHASYVSNRRTRSLERLEFLGDAILDKIIVTRVFAFDPPLQHFEMHMIKTALVNKDFLAFISLEEYGSEYEEKEVAEDHEVVTKKSTTALWKYMRHTSHAVGLEQAAMMERHANLRDEIRQALNHGTHYPWALLARMGAKKFYSDHFEALLGALWIDSGSLDVCASMVERFGIMGYLERILTRGVHMQHPKEELGIWAGNAGITYRIGVEVGASGDKVYTCSVLVGQRTVTEVKGGISKEEIKTKAADSAVRILTAENTNRRRSSRS